MTNYPALPNSLPVGVRQVFGEGHVSQVSWVIQMGACASV